MYLQKGRLPEMFELQKQLVAAGIPLVWFDDLPVSHDAFAPIHLAAIRGVYPFSDADLHASPDAPVTRAEAAGCPVVAVTIDLPAGRNAETQARFRRLDTRTCANCHTGPNGGNPPKPMFAGIEQGVGLTSPS